ncbi:hypothetical protein D9M69_692470 [compost metagenome]
MHFTDFTDHHRPVRRNHIEHPVAKAELPPGFNPQVVQIDIAQRGNAFGKNPWEIDAFQAEIEDLFGRATWDECGEFQNWHTGNIPLIVGQARQKYGVAKWRSK